MKKIFTEHLGLLVFAFVVLVGILLLMPVEVSTMEVLGLCLALIIIAAGFSWFFHFTSEDVGQAQSPPGPHPPGEESTPPEEQ